MDMGGRQIEMTCPKCGAYTAEDFDFITQDDGKKVQICRHCGWDSEADDIFDEKSKENDSEYNNWGVV